MPEAAARPACDTCPGFLISLPQVHEALDAHLWWEKGQLGEWLRGRRAAPGLNHYVGLVAGAVADADIERMAEAERDRKR